MHRARHAHSRAQADPPAAPPPHDWASRAAGLRLERPAQGAMLATIGAWMAVLAGWVAVLIPAGGDIRFKPLFWLLALPFMAWIWQLNAYRRWAIQTLGPALLAAPCAAVLALFAAQHRRAAVLPDDGLDTPLAMLVILGLTLAIAAAGLVALRRSSLPGGTRAPSYAVPGTLPAGVRAVPAAAVGILRLGSLAVSGCLVNGMFFAIVAIMPATDTDGFGPLWPIGLPVLAVLATGTLAIRGAFRLNRGTSGAITDLRLGWLLGMAGAVGFAALIWAWPTPLVLKAAFSAFTVPLAGLAVWAGLAARRRIADAAS